MYKCPSYYTMCQQSTVIFDYDSNRKVRDTSTSVKMPIDGQCPFCPWKCKSMNQSTFSMHISRKHAIELGRTEAPYMCTMCDQTFTARTHLNHHVANHHEMILQRCPHPGCSYRGKQKAAVVSHYVNVHMREVFRECKTAGSCTNCDKTNFSPYHIGMCMPYSPFVNSDKENMCVFI